MERSVLGNFLFPGEAVTGLEVERSVSRISYFLFPEKAVTGGKIRSVFPIPRRGGHRAGGGKIRLGEFAEIRLGIFLFPGEAVTGLEVERSVSEIRFGIFLIPEKAVTELEVERSVLEIRLGSREKKNSQRHSPSKKNDPRPGGIEPAVSKLQSCSASSH